jgi:hypothetical protein
MQTSVEGVYAIGDVASFPLLVAGGTLVRQEHVTHARSSAAQAAKALMGESTASLAAGMLSNNGCASCVTHFARHSTASFGILNTHAVYHDMGLAHVSSEDLCDSQVSASRSALHLC